MVSPQLELIADKHPSEDQLVRAIERLGPVKERPEFWLDIAGDESYTRLHRRHCIFQLFYRHIAPGLSLPDLARILKSPAWLPRRAISIVEDLGGVIPVTLTFDNTVLVLHILPDPTRAVDRWDIYISVTGHIDPDDFYRIIAGEAARQDTAAATILEIGFSPPALDSIKPEPGREAEFRDI